MPKIEALFDCIGVAPVCEVGTDGQYIVVVRISDRDLPNTDRAIKFVCT